jgi:hypothetical protein
MNKILIMLGLLFLNSTMALGFSEPDLIYAVCSKGSEKLSYAVDLRVADNPKMWGFSLSNENNDWFDGYPLLEKIIAESDRCKNISSFNDSRKITFLCAGELFMLTNIYGQVKNSTGADEVLSKILLQNAGWTCEETLN